MEPLVETFLCFAMFVCEMVLVKLWASLHPVSSRSSSAIGVSNGFLSMDPPPWLTPGKRCGRPTLDFFPSLRCGSNQQLDPPPSRWQVYTPGPERNQVGEASIKVGWHTTCNKPAYGRKQSCSSSRSQSGKELRHTRSSTRTSDNSLKQFHH